MTTRARAHTHTHTCTQTHTHTHTNTHTRACAHTQTHTHTHTHTHARMHTHTTHVHPLPTNSSSTQYGLNVFFKHTSFIYTSCTLHVPAISLNLYSSNPYGQNGEMAEEFGWLAKNIWLGGYKCMSPRDLKVREGTMCMRTCWVRSLLCMYEVRKGVGGWWTIRTHCSRHMCPH